MDAHLFKGFDGGTQLPLASIHHYQLRQFLTLRHHASITTMQHLLHRGKIVGSYHRLDVEMTIVATCRFAISEHDTTRHRIRALNITIVKALDMTRLDLQTKVTLHPLHQAVDTPVGIESLDFALSIFHILPCILLDDLQGLAFFTPLGHNDSNSLKIYIGHERQDKIFGAIIETFHHLPYRRREHLFTAAVIATLAIFEIQTASHSPMMQMHESDVCPIVALHVCEDTGVRHRRVANHTLGIITTDYLILLLQLLSLLEFPNLSKLSHLLQEHSLQFDGFAIQDLANSADYLAILFGIDLGTTWTATFADMIVETKTIFIASDASLIE